MAVVANAAATGLRELKKQRTRATLIDAAIHLCIEQGYENTTVEQIAAAAEIAPRTFSRYFPSKEAVIVAILGEVANDVAACYAGQPTDITQYEALARAHLEVFRSTQYGNRDSVAFERMRLLLTIVNSAPAIGLGPFMFRADGFHYAAVEVAAQRMGVPAGHPAIRILFDTWAVVMGVACHGLGTAGEPPVEPDILCNRIESVYGVFTRLWRP
ncbi:AcrR family transcriptional regulator [Mycolicibacterium sp. BK556]|uniref:TetR/AcrR family transcriptional regulator n=1 Tax=Mycobacteriaceae TaxID=1762 RepID=UPI00105D06BB|nr:TetR family transcriptional regulator [Mycobacterium sp. BK086]MBB3601967.1 AcrR family transcriptional regulator [Mycolicibacterium sp. BK556]MBB3631719.1 AcrR family transcriptional regulator [Mycolicibacterium sp. BK607]MBB3749724.1 AcrR family transcriptional regulator [Mycolicibacterium sp. BK634]TDO14061.1 TetR family transcriptional regulator [Mycobacterium sp. BK086]